MKTVSVDVVVIENVSVSWTKVRVVVLVFVSVIVLVVARGVMTYVGVIVVHLAALTGMVRILDLVLTVDVDFGPFLVMQVTDNFVVAAATKLE